MTQMRTSIVGMSAVKDEPFHGQNGDIWYVEGRFADGSMFSVGTKSIEKANRLHGEFSQLIGKECEFEVKEKRAFKGCRQWGLLNWPGKEEWAPRDGGGQSGEFKSNGSTVSAPRFSSNGRYRDSEDAAMQEKLSIHRSVALQQAVLFHNQPRFAKADVFPEQVCAVADVFYAWLTAHVAKPAASKAIDSYRAEIAVAVQAKDVPKLDEIRARVAKSVEKGSVTFDECDLLESDLSTAKRNIESAKELGEWVNKKQKEAAANEKLHPNPRMADTLEQAGEVF